MAKSRRFDVFYVVDINEKFHLGVLIYHGGELKLPPISLGHVGVRAVSVPQLYHCSFPLGLTEGRISSPAAGSRRFEGVWVQFGEV
jgi:hypothetical protein